MGRIELIDRTIRGQARACNLDISFVGLFGCCADLGASGPLGRQARSENVGGKEVLVRDKLA